MNATHPLKILMPPGRRRDDSEKPQSAGNLFVPSEKKKRINSTLALTTGTLSEMGVLHSVRGSKALARSC
jgi:hypothetical protein